MTDTTANDFNVFLVDEASARHPGTQSIIKFFSYAHLPQHLQEVSGQSADLAMAMVRALPDGPELTTGLRKLLEAKDCFVRARLEGI